MLQPYLSIILCHMLSCVFDNLLINKRMMMMRVEPGQVQVATICRIYNNHNSFQIATWQVAI